MLRAPHGAAMYHQCIVEGLLSDCGIAWPYLGLVYDVLTAIVSYCILPLRLWRTRALPSTCQYQLFASMPAPCLYIIILLNIALHGNDARHSTLDLHHTSYLILSAAGDIVDYLRYLLHILTLVLLPLCRIVILLPLPTFVTCIILILYHLVRTICACLLYSYQKKPSQRIRPVSPFLFSTDNLNLLAYSYGCCDNSSSAIHYSLTFVMCGI